MPSGSTPPILLSRDGKAKISRCSCELEVCMRWRRTEITIETHQVITLRRVRSSNHAWREDSGAESTDNDNAGLLLLPEAERLDASGLTAVSNRKFSEGGNDEGKKNG